MSDLLVTWNWNVSTPLHIGSGFSRAGFVDRCVPLEGDRAVIPSEAVKGAIRGAAEQLARWLGSQVTENEADSIPRIPVLQRLFAPDEHKSLYRFCGCMSANAVSAFSVSSTKINSETRSAEDNTLRTIEMLPGGMRFDGRIELLSGKWMDRASDDYHDLIFLLVALVSTEGIGGKKGAGLGRLHCSNIKLGDRAVQDELTTAETTETLRKVLKGK